MREKQLGDFMRIAHGFAFKGEHFSESGRYVVLTPGNFHESGGFRARPGKDRSYTARFPERYLLCKDDLIVAMTEQGEGLLGSAALVPESGVYLHNQRIGLASIDAEVGERRYFFYLLNSSSVRQQIRNSSSGTKVRHTSPERICQATAVIPDVEVQRKIAALLTAYDDLIENNRRRIALLERMAEQLYREWFVRFRFPGYQQAKFEKGVPKGWLSAPSSELFDVMSGGTPKTDVATYWNGDLPFFTPKDAPEDFYVLDTEKKVSPSGLAACNSKLYPKDTIFITARGTVGKLALAHRDMVMNQSCYALAPKQVDVPFFHFLALKAAVSTIKGVSNSGVFDNIVVDTFKIVPIRLPPDRLLQSFNSLMAPMFEQVGSLLSANIVLAKTRDLLLPRLISGKLRVDDLDIQFPPSMG